MLSSMDSAVGVQHNLSESSVKPMSKQSSSQADASQAGRIAHTLTACTRCRQVISASYHESLFIF